jgi:DNA-binding PadR family transcriptional regulator
MRNFPWFWQQDGDAWEAMLHRGGPHGRRDPRDDPREGRRHDPHREHARAHFGPGGPEEPPPPPPPGWGPGGRGGNPFGGNPFGGNPFGGNPFGFGPFGGGGGGRRGRGGRGWDWGPFGKGPRVRRGDVRSAVLVLLAEQPRNGYQIIQEIAERSDGMWKPSSGSVYPALQQLEDEGLVETDTQEGKRTFRLTEAGRTYVEAHKTELGTPWDAMKGEVDESSTEIHHLIGQVALAVVQVTQAGNPAQVERARQVLVNARRSLYQILAEDDGEADAEQGG